MNDRRVNNQERMTILARKMGWFWTIDYQPPYGKPPVGEQYQVAIQDSGIVVRRAATDLDTAIESALTALAEMEEQLQATGWQRTIPIQVTPKGWHWGES